MTERERLIDILKNNQGDKTYYATNNSINEIVDVLLANGVIVPPCKVGDTAYWVTAWDSYATQKDHKGIINSIKIKANDIYFSTEHKTLRLSDYKKTWFNNEDEQKIVVRIMQKSRKDAEKALKECEG